MSQTEKKCAETVKIPPSLPDILKQYAKGAMRTQPPDLLRWSGAYFRCLANGETLPTKDKLEVPLRQNADGLTPGIIRVIDAQLGSQSGQKIKVFEIKKRYWAFGIPVTSFDAILNKARMAHAVGNDSTIVEWDKLIAVMAYTIGNTITDTMVIICDILTEQPDGSDALINYTTWWNLYSYLMTEVQVLGDISPAQIAPINDYLLPISKQNTGLIAPKDFNTASCPGLDPL